VTRFERREIERTERMLVSIYRHGAGMHTAGALNSTLRRLKHLYREQGKEMPSKEWLLAKHPDKKKPDHAPKGVGGTGPG